MNIDLFLHVIDVLLAFGGGMMFYDGLTKRATDRVSFYGDCIGGVMCLLVALFNIHFVS